MSFRFFSIPEMLSVTGPMTTPGHAERAVLEALLSTAGVVRFVVAVHGDLLGLLTDEERVRLGLLRDGLYVKNLRHDTLARLILYCLRAHELLHELLHGDTPEGRAITDVRTVLFPDELRVVQVSYRETAGRASGRIAQLTPERRAVLAEIPVQGGNLLTLVDEWNQVGTEMGEIQDQRVTPVLTEAERVKRRATRSRWVRTVKTLLGALALEAQDSPEAQRIIGRVAGIQAEVARRARAGQGDTPTGDGGEDDPVDDVDDGLDSEPGSAPAPALAPAAASR